MGLTYRLCILIFAGCCFASAVRAQNVYNIRGIVYTKGSSERVSQALVTNKRNHTTTITDDQGAFALKAALGDTLEIAKVDYSTVQQVIMGPADVAVLLQQVVHLSQVIIRGQGQSKQQELNDVMKQYRSKGVYENGSPSTLSSIAHPINALYDLFGKDPANARRFAEYSKKEQEASADHKKYNKELVKRITNLPDDELDKFMGAFTPSHEDLQKWTDYDVISYIKKSLEEYKKFGAPALQKLY